MLLRFVEGRPVSQVTEDFLGWLCAWFAAEGKQVFVLVWDNASWHVSKRVRRWIGAHNRTVKRGGGCKIRVCYLPIKASWRNPIEPKGAHEKKAIVEPERTLTAQETRERVCQHYRCDLLEPLEQKVPGSCTSNCACAVKIAASLLTVIATRSAISSNSRRARCRACSKR